MSGPTKGPKPAAKPAPKPSPKSKEEEKTNDKPQPTHKPDTTAKNELTPFQIMIKLILERLNINESNENDSPEKKKEKDRKYGDSKAILEIRFYDKKNMDHMQFKNLDITSIVKTARTALNDNKSSNSIVTPSHSDSNEKKSDHEKKSEHGKKTEMTPSHPKSPIKAKDLQKRIKEMAGNKAKIAGMKVTADLTQSENKSSVTKKSKMSLKPNQSNGGSSS